jgi:hypothetical protein
MENLHELIFGTEKHVTTLFGEGITLPPKRLADIVLPTGVITIGFPSWSIINETCDVHPHVSPGTYPVYLVRAQHTHRGNTWNSVAFVYVEFQKTEREHYTKIGYFFTDSGDGVIVDRSLEQHICSAKQHDLNEWLKLREKVVFGDGNGEIILDEQTGTNAIIFFSGDGYYDVWIGREKERERVTSLIVDGVSLYTELQRNRESSRE